MKNNPFRYFKTSPGIIRLPVMMVIRYPLSLRQVEQILFERGIDISHRAIRYWWNRFGLLFAGEIGKRRIEGQHRSSGLGTRNVESSGNAKKGEAVTER